MNRYYYYQDSMAGFDYYALVRDSGETNIIGYNYGVGTEYRVDTSKSEAYLVSNNWTDVTNTMPQINYDTVLADFINIVSHAVS